MRDSDRATIETFVRQGLGCRCPDEVFRRVALEARRGADAGVPFMRLVVGDRLLIYVMSATNGDEVSGEVRRLARAGIRDRDESGCHRFRLVVAAGDVAALSAAVAVAFRQEVGLDERAHAHVVSRDQLPDVLRPASTNRVKSHAGA